MIESNEQTDELFQFGIPFGARLIIQTDDAAENTKGGIIIPDSARERPQFGTVMAVGKDVTEDIQKGDRVMFGKHAGVPMSIQDQTFYIMQDREIFMKVNEEAVANEITSEFARNLQV